MNLFLTRHGETQWNRKGLTQGVQDISLNDKGKHQAIRLGERLVKSPTPINTIYCSDLSRARTTADIIGKKLNIEPISLSLLREVNFGVWEGLSIDEIELSYPGELQRWRSDYNFAPKGGESLAQVWSRIQVFIDKVKRDHNKYDENIIVVSHGATTKVLILGVLGFPLGSLLSLRMTQTGLSLLSLEDKRNALIFLNDICHLRGLGDH